MTVIGFTRPKDRIKDSVKEAEDMGFTVMAAPSLEIFTGDDEEFDKLMAMDDQENGAFDEGRTEPEAQEEEQPAAEPEE